MLLFTIWILSDCSEVTAESSSFKEERKEIFASKVRRNLVFTNYLEGVPIYKLQFIINISHFTQLFSSSKKVMFLLTLQSGPSLIWHGQLLRSSHK